MKFIWKSRIILEPGLLLDILISNNKVIVANAENNRMEVIYTIP